MMKQTLGRLTALLAAMLLISHTAASAQVTGTDQEEWNTEALMQQLAAVEEAELSFIEEKSSDFLVDVITLKGSLLYRAPDYVRKSTETPFRENIEINGDWVTVEKITARGELNSQKYAITASEILNLTVEGIRATLAGNLDVLSDSYDVALSGGMTDWHVVLTPKNATIKAHVEQITVTGSNEKISTIETINNDGDESTLTLSYIVIK